MTELNVREIEEHAREYYQIGYDAGGQEAWDILAPLLDGEILHKVYGASEKFIFDRWPSWDPAKERLIEYQRTTHQNELEKKVRNFINFMVQSGFTQDEVLGVWYNEVNASGA